MFTHSVHHSSSGEVLEQIQARFQATLTTLGSGLTRGGVVGGGAVSVSEGCGSHLINMVYYY